MKKPALFLIFFFVFVFNPENAVEANFRLEFLL